MLEAGDGGYYLVNSEGTEVRAPESATYLRAQATAQAPDGMTVRDAVAFHSLDAARMPTDAELNRGVTALAENVVALAHAPKGEDYSGPVLFEGVAGAQIFAEVLGRNLALTRRPAMEQGRGGGFSASELEGRIGARILPDSFDVVDDPTQKEWRGRPLFGSYDVDREGVAAEPLRLVEKGVLKGFLLTRQPVRGFEGSNGRARMPGSYGASAAGISNLFVSSSEATPAAELKKKLIDLCQTRDKPYGIIVRKMDFPSSASLDEVRRLLSGAQGSDAAGQHSDPGLQGLPGWPRRAGAGPALPRVECPLVEGHPGGGRRQHGIRVHEQPGAVRPDRRFFLHGRNVRGGALHSDRRSGAASGGGGVAQAAGGAGAGVGALSGGQSCA